MGSAALLVACGQRVEIHNTVKHVDGFELVHVNGSGMFGVHKAAWANYPFFVYRGETYERAGVGAVIVRQESRATDYVVREETIARDENGGTTRSRISIHNRKSGELLASRELKKGQVENGTGWEGEHAALFVRQVLVPDAHIGGADGVKPYPRIPAQVEVLASEESNVEHYQIVGCSPDFLLEGWPKTLKTRLWRFRPQGPISAVSCSGEFVAVISEPLPGSVYLDLLSKDGRTVAQSELRFSVPSAAHLVRVDQLSFADGGVRFDLEHAISGMKDGVVRWSAYQTHRVSLALNQ